MRDINEWHSAGETIVPHAMQHLNEIWRRAKDYTVSGGPVIYIVKFISLESGKYTTMVVDSDNRVCNCLQWQDEDLPCVHAAAFSSIFWDSSSLLGSTSITL